MYKNSRLKKIKYLLIVSIIITSNAYSSDFCSNADFSNIYKESANVLEIQILRSKLKGDSDRHIHAKNVLAEFKVIKILKGKGTGHKSLEYKSTVVPEPGYSLSMFRPGAMYRIYSNDLGVFNFKPCINAVPLKKSN